MAMSPLVQLLQNVFAQPVDNLGDVTQQLLGGPASGSAANPTVVAAAPANGQGPQPVQAATAQSGPGCVAPGLSARDNAYLNNYYGPVAAKAAAYGVNPAFVLGNGYESGFGTSNIYRGTGDALR